MGGYKNKGIRQYTDAEKRAYYAKKAAMMGKKQLYGQGRYAIGRPYIRGQGGYKIPKNFFNARKVGTALGATGGGLIGNMIAPGIGGKTGAALGGALGGKLGGLFKSITGYGDYNITENSVVFPDRIVPEFGEDSIRVKKREYICDIDATTAFTNNSFPVNPGLSETFPWLSAIATNYEQYRINGMVFQFVSTSSDAIASTTDLGLGQVILASDYNAADAAYVNAPQMLSSKFANSAKPSENIMHAVECAPSDVAQKLYYVRSGDVPEGTDIRLYDMLSFQIATQKMPADYDGCGQLWVTYDITFCKAIQNNQLGYGINTDSYILVAPDDTGDDQFGTSQTLQAGSNLGTTIEDNHILKFPPPLASGYYLINYIAFGAATAVVQPTFAFTNCAKVMAWNNNADDDPSNSGTSATAFFQMMIVKITDRDAKITLTGGTLPGTPTHGDLKITQINGEIFT